MPCFRPSFVRFIEHEISFIFTEPRISLHQRLQYFSEKKKKNLDILVSSSGFSRYVEEIRTRAALLELCSFHMVIFRKAMAQSLPWIPDSCSAGQEISYLCGIRRFITVFTKAYNWTLSWAIFIQTTLSRPVSLRLILILSSHQRLRLPSDLFVSGLHFNGPYACYLSLHSHYQLLQVTKLIISFRTSCYPSFLPSLGPNVVLNTMFSNTVKQYFFLRTRHQVSHTYRRVYPEVSGLAAWSENCKWHSCLPPGAIVSLFDASV